MQNYQGTIDTPNQPQISQSDKLLFCTFLAVAFHGMLFFGVGFKLPDLSGSQNQKTFDVVLAQFEADKKPEKADFIAQADQEGGGDNEMAIAPSATEMAQFNDPELISSEPEKMHSAMEVTPPAAEILTGNGHQSASVKPTQPTKRQDNIPDAASLIDKSYQLSGFIASLDNQNSNQAKKGRKRFISAATHRASDALYLDSWRRKIERVGNMSYPEKAKLNNIFGNLTLSVAINKDGTIHKVSIIKSSGSQILDNAALRIVRLAAPFGPLTSEMSKDTDILEIIRIWRFQPDYRLETN